MTTRTVAPWRGAEGCTPNLAGRRVRLEASIPFLGSVAAAFEVHRLLQSAHPVCATPESCVATLVVGMGTAVGVRSGNRLLELVVGVMTMPPHLKRAVQRLVI